MTHEALRKSRHEWSAAALGGAAAVLLALAAAFMLHFHNSQMQTLREQAAQTRARLMAQSIGQRLTQATAAGIPLHQLVGVPQFLARWHDNHPDVAHIAVHDHEGRLLWYSPAGSAPLEQGVGTGGAQVAPAGIVQARVEMQVRHASAQGPGRMLGLLAPAVLLVSALAWLGARFACAQGPWLRNHGVRMMARWAVRGDYRRLLLLPQRKSFDLRVQEVAQAMHRMHERMMRMRLLIGSLRRTEPQQLRRDYLDQLLQRTESRDRFADTAPDSVRLVAVQSQSMWMALLLCLGAVGPLTHALVAVHTAGQAGPWPQALPAACLGVLMLAAAAGWRLGTRLRIATLSVLILSLVALALPLLALLLGSGLHPAGIAAWNGSFAGAALAACTRAQTHPDAHPGFAHAAPRLPGAALLAWWGAMLWLAPTLGYYAQVALPLPGAALTLLLPMGCGLWFALRWDGPHSPWRVRMATACAPRRDAPVWRERRLGTAAGLVAGPMLLALATSASAAPGALLQQCALGLGLALVWSMPAQNEARWRAIALMAIALQLALLAAPALPAAWPLQWHPPVAALASLLLGLLLGHALAGTTHAPQETASPRLLLGGALGAGLSAAASVAGLQGWLALLALLLLAPLRATRAKDSDVP